MFKKVTHYADAKNTLSSTTARPVNSNLSESMINFDQITFVMETTVFVKGHNNKVETPLVSVIHLTDGNVFVVPKDVTSVLFGDD